MGKLKAEKRRRWQRQWAELQSREGEEVGQDQIDAWRSMFPDGVPDMEDMDWSELDPEDDDVDPVEVLTRLAEEKDEEGWLREADVLWLHAGKARREKHRGEDRTADGYRMMRGDRAYVPLQQELEDGGHTWKLMTVKAGRKRNKELRMRVIGYKADFDPDIEECYKDERTAQAAARTCRQNARAEEYARIDKLLKQRRDSEGAADNHEDYDD